MRTKLGVMSMKDRCVVGEIIDSSVEFSDSIAKTLRLSMLLDRGPVTRPTSAPPCLITSLTPSARSNKPQALAIPKKLRYQKDISPEYKVTRYLGLVII